MSTAKPSASRSRKEDGSSNSDLNAASIGNYVFVKTLGEGNFAKVKLAKHKLTSAEVAIKIIDKTTLDEKKLGKLYREVRIMKMLHHPHIVKLYEVIETKTTMFLVMEYSSGGELYDYLVVHGKMKEKEARAKFRQILSAVGYCHKKRVIHRDLKAENLLLDANLDIKIADFGFSNVFDPDSKLDTFCGSPPYAAPELFQGRRYTGPEVDIWSLGVILYVLTTGCLPFDGKNLQDMRESVCKGKYRIPFYLSDGCEKLLRKLLVRDPAKRASLDIFIDDAWINEGYDHSPITKDVSQKVEEDENIIRLIEMKYHVEKGVIQQSLRDNVYDDISAIYYMLYHEKETRGRIEADSPVATSPPAPLPAVDKGEGNKSGTMKTTAPAMTAIQEDAPLSSSADQSMPVAQPRANAAAAAAKPSRRRFTVGTDAEVQKYAEEDEEAARLLSKLQQQPAAANATSAVPATNTISPSSSAKEGEPIVTVKSNVIAGAKAQVPAIVTGTHAPSKTEAKPIVAMDNITTATANASSTESADDDKNGTRKRHNTIVGILRSTLNYKGDQPTSPTMNPISPSVEKGGDIVGGVTEASSISVNDNEAFEPVKPGEEGKPRSLRFTFSSNTTSSKPPDDIVKEVIATCVKQGVTHKLASRYLVECHWMGGKENPEEGVKFDIEICRLPRLKNLHGLRFKRASGSSNDYKEICEKLVSLLQL